MDLKTKLGSGVVAAAIVLVAAWEGRSLVAYVDPVGIPTICEGYTQGVKLGDVVTPERCDALTEQEVRRALAVVDRSVTYPLPGEVRVALSSFVYNVGAGAYVNSTLLRKLRGRDIDGACRELDRWVYAGGRKLRGLERRRQAERQLCLSSLH